MTLEHKIRIAVGALRGEARTAAILALRLYPEKLHALKKLAFSKSGKRKKRILKVYKDHYPIAFCVRITAEQYVQIRDDAAKLDVSISRLARARLSNHRFEL